MRLQANLVNVVIIKTRWTKIYLRKTNTNPQTVSVKLKCWIQERDFKKTNTLWEIHQSDLTCLITWKHLKVSSSLLLSISRRSQWKRCQVSTAYLSSISKRLKISKDNLNSVARLDSWNSTSDLNQTTPTLKSTSGAMTFRALRCCQIECVLNDFNHIIV